MKGRGEPQKNAKTLSKFEDVLQRVHEKQKLRKARSSDLVLTVLKREKNHDLAERKGEGQVRLLIVGQEKLQNLGHRRMPSTVGLPNEHV